MRLRPLAVTAAVLTAALGTGSAHAAPSSPIGQHGRWITDAQGRVVIVHGVNMVAKRPPYSPVDFGFGPEDAEFLASHGFNTVRLGLIHKGVEPSPGAYDEAYLDRIATSVAHLRAAGILVQLDFHQDLFHERFQGEGEPDWAVFDDGLPAQPQAGFPGNYLVMPALWRAFDHFWNNDPGPGGVGLQDRYAAAWKHVAQRFKDEPHLMGYDLFNEPWPGSEWATCANPVGCPLFDAKLTAFSQRVAAKIREADPAGVVWYEPHVIFNNGAKTSHGTVPGAAGMSFHVYCLADQATSNPADPLQDVACGDAWETLPFANAEEQSARFGDALLLSEFGATDDLGQVARVVDLAEDAMVGWQYWHYCECHDPTTTGSGGTQSLVRDAHAPPSGDNVKHDKLAVLAIPYPQVVAGTPRDWAFDRASGRFDFTWSTTRAAGGAFPAGSLTEVAVPAVQYPSGYRVTATGAEVVSAPGASTLVLRSCAGAASVSVTVARGAGAPASACAPAPAASGGLSVGVSGLSLSLSASATGGRRISFPRS